MSKLLQNTLVYVLIVSMLSIGSPLAAQAGVIGTLEGMQSLRANASDPNLARVNEALARDEVRERMQALGVDPAQVEARLARLTPSELESLANRIDSMPAGAGALEVIGIVFLVLLILEAVGVIDIFKKFP